jgi:N-methylhydantoinase B
MKDVKIAQTPSVEIDPVTLDIIENALKNTRFEMDACYTARQ